MSGLNISFGLTASEDELAAWNRQANFKPSCCPQEHGYHFGDVNKMVKTKANESRTFRNIWK